MQRPIQIQVVATPSDAHNLSGATSDRKQERERGREGQREEETVDGREVWKLNYNAQFGQSKTSDGGAEE